MIAPFFEGTGNSAHPRMQLSLLATEWLDHPGKYQPALLTAFGYYIPPCASSPLTLWGRAYEQKHGGWVKNEGAKTERRVVNRTCRERKEPPPPSRDVHKSSKGVVSTRTARETVHGDWGL